MIFSVLENPIRRKILAKLAKEQHYPLQLSKELNISQQAIMKHLKVLEDNDLVISFEEKSTLGGPPRKSYVSNKRISLRIDVGPNTFHTDIYDYKELDDKEQKKMEKNESKSEYKTFEERYRKSSEIKNPTEKLKEYSTIIQDLNSELEDIKIKRAQLLNLREHVMKQSNRLISELCGEYDERKILYYIITHNDRNVATISEVMEMRERVIEEIFKNLIRQRILTVFEEEF